MGRDSTLEPKPEAPGPFLEKLNEWVEMRRVVAWVLGRQGRYRRLAARSLQVAVPVGPLLVVPRRRRCSLSVEASPAYITGLPWRPWRARSPGAPLLCCFAETLCAVAQVGIGTGASLRAPGRSLLLCRGNDASSLPLPLTKERDAHQNPTQRSQVWWTYQLKSRHNRPSETWKGAYTTATGCNSYVVGRALQHSYHPPSS